MSWPKLSWSQSPSRRLTRIFYVSFCACIQFYRASSSSSMPRHATEKGLGTRFVSTRAGKQSLGGYLRTFQASARIHSTAAHQLYFVAESSILKLPRGVISL